MTDTERDLRTAMNNLLCMITLSGRMNQTVKELEALFAVSDFEKRIFEQPQQMRGYAEAKAMLYGAVEQIKATYLTGKAGSFPDDERCPCNDHCGQSDTLAGESKITGRKCNLLIFVEI